MGWNKDVGDPGSIVTGNSEHKVKSWRQMKYTPCMTDSIILLYEFASFLNVPRT